MNKRILGGTMAVVLLCLVSSCMRLAILEENKKSQDFFGKVIDQSGEPVAGVEVAGNLILNDGSYGGFNVKKYMTETDGNGTFEFTGIHGASLNVLVNKEGYKMGARGEGYKGPVGGKSSPDNRVILMMWKIRGAEPLVSSGIDAKIPCDGSSSTFDMATGKESSDGDLKITLSRFPMQIKPGLVHRYNWQVKIAVLQGGLIEESDPYPYWAPDGGYRPLFEFEASSNSVPWKNQLERNFYIKNLQGRYGRVRFEVFSATTPARVKMKFTVNPSGLQNLEPDFSK